MKQARIEDGLNEYVLDRMDGVIPFFYLSIGEYRSVVIKKIRKIVEEFKLNNPKIKLRLNNVKGFVDQFVTQTFHAKMSNREALMALSEKLRNSISNEANSHSILEKVEVSLDGTRQIKSDSCKAIFSE